MNYYQEIYLLPSVDIGVYFLWQKLYQQIHLALVENKKGDNVSVVGIDFPEYDAGEYSLGTKLRLFSNDKLALEQVHCERWLDRLNDYVHLGKIKHVPEKVLGYACYRHARLKGSKEKLARRRAKRTGETLQEALTYFETYKEKRSRLPYVNMVSQTTKQRFRLFIEKLGFEQQQAGSFSCYGLSDKATVPLF